ncbi:hypothetical protein [Kribbella sp. NPDC051620]|uniref:hypothetical protein n=1 Tax=Kribbella sp. NPDC051620 TaxID=3364120 RepID=UPI0037B5E080
MAIDPKLISLSLAHGMTPGMIASWNPKVPRTPRVLVPIQLDALVVRKEEGTWAKVAMEVPETGSDRLAYELLAEPFAEREPRKPGVYLHWALPDALTRGSGTAASGDVAFPAVPDRWLVIRLSSGKEGTRRAVSGWVIEAGDETPTVVPLDEWTEPVDPESTTVPGQEPLTALGHGDTAWSAYFDNVEGRLGFYDDLSQLGGLGKQGDVRGPLAYLVCGWHSRMVDDPIGENLRSPTQFETRLDGLGWEVNPADIETAFVYAQNRVKAAGTVGLVARESRFAVQSDPAVGKKIVADGAFGETSTQLTSAGIPALGKWLAQAVSWPQLTLYHGAVVGLGWPDAGLPVAPEGLLGGVVGGPPDANAVTVTIGNTLTEALAARLAANQGNADEARILEAVLLGGTDELDMPDSAARIDSRLHASGFAGLPGGVVTEPVTQTASVQPSSVVPDPSKTDPGVFRGRSGGGRRPGKLLSKTHFDGVLVASTGTTPIAHGSPKLGIGAMDKVLQAIKSVEEVTVRVPSAPNAEPVTQTIDAKRALPRFFVPADPVFLIEGGGRAFKHGFDGMYAETQKLVCRLSGHTVTGLAPRRLVNLPGAAVRGEDLLDRRVDHGGVPVECDDLVRELALLDPGSAPVAVRSRFGGNARFDAAALDQAAEVFAVEQTVWQVARDDRRDIGPLLSLSGFAGTLPAAMAVALPRIPWVPLHLDWEVELYSSPEFADWQLEEIDFDAVPDSLPDGTQSGVRTLRGRALLGGGAAQVAASTVRDVLEQAQQSAGSISLTPKTTHAFHSQAALEMVSQISTMASLQTQRAADDADLDHIADELEKMDVLVGAMDRFNSILRSGFVADGVAKPADGVVPADFWPVRSGFLKVKRLRLVDCFGQVLDLAGSSATEPAKPELIMRTEPLTVADRPDLVELAPRFTAPSRLWFRFVSATDDVVEANDATSPVCGFVLPNHLDGDLQFHAADGVGLGAVRFDGGRLDVEAGTGVGAGIVWEDSPGQPTNLGSAPSGTIGNRHLAGIAQGLLDWGVVDATPDAPAVDTALSSLLRIVDSSLWSVDPFGHIGEEHLALLVGHPIAVLRALIRVEVDEPVAPDLVRGIRVPVRVGALAHWQDGLLGYFVGDDYRTLHVSDPAAADFARPVGPHQGFNGQASSTSDYYTDFATDLGVIAQPGSTPVDHPYVDTSGVLWVQPQQDVWLTLLMEPHSVVHATTGFLPRKEIGMRRSWVAPGLSRLAPVFRFGPVLVDPKLIRMPIAADIRGTWTWNHRADATTWAEDPIVNSTSDARIPPDPSEGQEGWLKLTPEEES